MVNIIIILREKCDLIICNCSHYYIGENFINKLITQICLVRYVLVFHYNKTTIKVFTVRITIYYNKS